MAQHIVIRNIKVQNANALSSHITIGFPALTAWLGFMHAIQRQLNNTEGFSNIKLNKIAIACHDFKLHTYKGPGDYHHSIINTANPVKRDGQRPTILEEPRCNFNVSLLINCENVNSFKLDLLKETLMNLLLSRMKIAGGDILSIKKVDFSTVESDYEKRRLLNSLMPSYLITEKKSLVKENMEKGLDALDSLVDALSVYSYPIKDEKGKIEWHNKRKHTGWLVPIITGFHGISELTAPNETLLQRDNKTPHRFVEPIVTLGEYKMPPRIERFEQAFWIYKYLKDQNLYLCINEGE